ncbi:MAG TPA: HD domain-containing phosphohydrolase [Gemmatimonadales bacterium]|nr:HD domain-containing phosphohydrolase [Gemmatimonadales bacterium]
MDDEEPVRSALGRFLRQRGYEVRDAGTGERALELLLQEESDGVLLDVRLPGISGIDLVPQVLEVAPRSAIVMLTAVTDGTTAALCLQRGAMEYLTKPFELAELDRALARAITRRRSQPRTPSAGPAPEQLVVASLSVLVNAFEGKYPYSRGHSTRVADYGAMIAAELGLPDVEIEGVRTAGRMHDVGMIGIRDEVANKQGPLTDDEFAHIKDHVIIGSQILAPIDGLREVMGYVRGHHERWDGRGYPDGLAGEAIPIGGRILAAVEIYDALTTSRPYQEKMPPEHAIARMRDLIGSSIEARVYDALAAVVERRRVLVFLDDSDG